MRFRWASEQPYAVPNSAREPVAGLSVSTGATSALYRAPGGDALPMPSGLAQATLEGELKGKVAVLVSDLQGRPRGRPGQPGARAGGPQRAVGAAARHGEAGLSSVTLPVRHPGGWRGVALPGLRRERRSVGRSGVMTRLSRSVARTMRVVVSTQPPLRPHELRAAATNPGGVPAFRQPVRSTIRRIGRLLAPSMQVSSSAFSARPPQPPWRARSRMSRSGRSRRGMCTSFTIRSLPRWSQTIRRYQDGKAASGSSRARCRPASCLVAGRPRPASRSFCAETGGEFFRLALHHPYRPFQIRQQDRAVEWRDHRQVRPPQPVMAMHHCHHD